MKQILALGLIAFLFSSCDNMKHQVKDFSQYFDEYNVDGAFVMYDVNEDKYVGYNLLMGQRGFIPAST